MGVNQVFRFVFDGKPPTMKSGEVGYNIYVATLVSRLTSHVTGQIPEDFRKKSFNLIRSQESQDSGSVRTKKLGTKFRSFRSARTNRLVIQLRILS